MRETARGPQALAGAGVLVVEDEYYLADDLVRTLGEAGARVVGPANSLAEAERLIAQEQFDCAVVDMNLRGEAAFPIADRLVAAAIPFVIATGYSAAALPDRFADRPRVEKPFQPRQIVAALRTLERR